MKKRSERAEKRLSLRKRIINYIEVHADPYDLNCSTFGTESPLQRLWRTSTVDLVSGMQMVIDTIKETGETEWLFPVVNGESEDDILASCIGFVDEHRRLLKGGVA